MTRDVDSSTVSPGAVVTVHTQPADNGDKTAVRVFAFGRRADGTALTTADAAGPFAVERLIRDGRVDREAAQSLFPRATIRAVRILQNAPGRRSPQATDLGSAVCSVPANSELLVRASVTPPEGRPPDLPGPTLTLMKALSVEGCAMVWIDPESHALRGSAECRLLTDIVEFHREARTRAAASGLRRPDWMPLEYAHLVDAPTTVKRVIDQGWPGHWQADLVKLEFHQITNITVLCTACHTLYDQQKTLSPAVVAAAARALWARPHAKDALLSFVRGSLRMRSGHTPDGTNIALAVNLLATYHPGEAPFDVSPDGQLKKHIRFGVDPILGAIHGRMLDEP
ncbi:hypothetical protein [Yinghuangia sp. YIM S09857]|uniref:hypothetical protein n=1 Tax=Yinghuangia sp. YIM S09857 TaxID=3436929 RepID=UPI003F5340A7